MKNKSNQEREAIAKSKKDLADEMKDDFWTKGEKNQNFLSKINKVVNDINNADDDGTAHKDTISSMLAAQLLDLRVFRKYNELQERYNKKDKSLDLIETEKFFKEYPNVEEALDEPFVQDELNNLISGKIDNFDLFNQGQDAIILDDYNKNKLYEGVTINLLLKEANIPATNVIGQKGQKWISNNVQSKNGLEFAVINISSNHWVLAFKEKNKIHVIDPMGKNHITAEEILPFLGSPFNIENISNIIIEDLPIQLNGEACGPNCVTIAKIANEYDGIDGLKKYYNENNWRARAGIEDMNNIHKEVSRIEGNTLMSHEKKAELESKITDKIIERNIEFNNEINSWQNDILKNYLIKNNILEVKQGSQNDEKKEHNIIEEENLTNTANIDNDHQNIYDKYHDDDLYNHSNFAKNRKTQSIDSLLYELDNDHEYYDDDHYDDDKDDFLDEKERDAMIKAEITKGMNIAKEINKYNNYNDFADKKSLNAIYKEFQDIYEKIKNPMHKFHSSNDNLGDSEFIKEIDDIITQINALNLSEITTKDDQYLKSLENLESLGKSLKDLATSNSLMESTQLSATIAESINDDLETIGIMKAIAEEEIKEHLKINKLHEEHSEVMSESPEDHTIKLAKIYTILKDIDLHIKNTIHKSQTSKDDLMMRSEIDIMRKKIDEYHLNEISKFDMNFTEDKALSIAKDLKDFGMLIKRLAQKVPDLKKMEFKENNTSTTNIFSQEIKNQLEEIDNYVNGFDIIRKKAGIKSEKVKKDREFYWKNEERDDDIEDIENDLEGIDEEVDYDDAVLLKRSSIEDGYNAICKVVRDSHDTDEIKMNTVRHFIKLALSTVEKKDKIEFDQDIWKALTNTKELVDDKVVKNLIQNINLQSPHITQETLFNKFIKSLISIIDKVINSPTTSRLLGTHIIEKLNHNKDRLSHYISNTRTIS